MTSNEFSNFLKRMINQGHSIGCGIVSDEDDFINSLIDKYDSYIEEKINIRKNQKNFLLLKNLKKFALI